MKLARTATALAAYDAYDASEPWRACQTNGDVYAMEARFARLAKAVGHAFGLDTADRNAMDTCEGCVLPGHHRRPRRLTLAGPSPFRASVQPRWPCRTPPAGSPR